MTVTGSDWEPMTLGKLIPALDPDDSRSAACRLKEKIGSVANDITGGIDKVENVVGNITSTLKVVGDLGDEIQKVQGEIESLVGNAVNTGVYMHLLGCDPVGQSIQPIHIVEELREILSDDTDPNRPQFKSNTSSVGGILIINTAPTMSAMLTQLKQMSIVFPAFASTVSTTIEEATEVVDIFSSEMSDGIKQSINVVTGEWGKVTNWALDYCDFKGMWDSSEVKEIESFEQADVKNKWVALRVSQMIPAFDPTIPNSSANLIMSAERSLVSGGLSILQQVGGMSTQLDKLTKGVNSLNKDLKELTSTITDMVDGLGRTGIYTHMLGLDGSVKSTAELNSAAGRAMLDIQDKNRPQSSGKSGVFAGMLIVFGAANFAAFGEKTNNLTSIFSGLGGSVKKIGRSFKF